MHCENSTKRQIIIYYVRIVYICSCQMETLMPVQHKYPESVCMRSKMFYLLHNLWCFVSLSFSLYRCKFCPVYTYFRRNHALFVFLSPSSCRKIVFFFRKKKNCRIKKTEFGWRFRCTFLKFKFLLVNIWFIPFWRVCVCVCTSLKPGYFAMLFLLYCWRRKMSSAVSLVRHFFNLYIVDNFPLSLAFSLSLSLLCSPAQHLFFSHSLHIDSIYYCSLCSVLRKEFFPPLAHLYQSRCL